MINISAQGSCVRRRARTVSPTPRNLVPLYPIETVVHSHANSYQSTLHTELLTYVDDVTPYIWQMRTKVLRAGMKWCRVPTMFNANHHSLTDCINDSFVLENLITSPDMDSDETVPAMKSIVVFPSPGDHTASRVVPNICISTRPLYSATTLLDYESRGCKLLPYVSSMFIRIYFKSPGWAFASDACAELNARDAWCGAVLLADIKSAVRYHMGITVRSFLAGHDTSRCWVYVLEQLPAHMRKHVPPRLWCMGSMSMATMRFESNAFFTPALIQPVFDELDEWPAPEGVIPLPSLRSLVEESPWPYTAFGISMFLNNGTGPHHTSHKSDAASFDEPRFPCSGILLVNRNSAHMALMQTAEQRLWAPFNCGCETVGLALLRFLVQTSVLELLAENSSVYREIHTSLACCITRASEVTGTSAVTCSIIRDFAHLAIRETFENDRVTIATRSVAALSKLLSETITRCGVVVDVHTLIHPMATDC